MGDNMRLEGIGVQLQPQYAVSCGLKKSLSIYQSSWRKENGWEGELPQHFSSVVQCACVSSLLLTGNGVLCACTLP